MGFAVTTILLVEDNDDAAELTMIAFRRAHVENQVVRVCDGIEALDYLFRRGAYAERGPDEPGVVLLDLNLPKLEGVAVLEAIRASKRFKHLPVVVLTSSTDDGDRLGAYRHHVNSYIRKPVDFEQFVAAAGTIGLYWLVLNEPPPWT
jgi:two-component system response regulator